MITLLLHLLRLLPLFFGGYRQLAIENLALRQQLAVYKRSVARPRLRTADRLFWIGLTKVWTEWRQSLVFVTPETVLRWQRRRFREHWAKLSGRPTVGRPPVNAELRALVRKMAAANPLWGAPRIHGELLKLGIDVAERTVSRLIPKRRTPPSQTWRTFLTNHVQDLVSTDFFTVPTARLRVLFVLFILAIIGVGSGTSTSPSIPPLLGPPSKSWTPSPTILPPPISYAIAMRSTGTPSASA
jgi:putative transposase